MNDPHDPEREPASRAESRIEPDPDLVEQAMADSLDNVVPAYGNSELTMVGIGGSAGAVQALQTFFSTVAPDTGMVFVVVMHLAADHDSALAAILGRATTMPVTQVEGRVAVEPNHVYVIPPGRALQSIDGHLDCTDLTPDRGRRVAVDLFFRSLADSHGAHACAIVLSGIDGDGAIGLKRIKERGGLTIAQDPDEAGFDGMPRSAIATGMVDWILPVADMPARLARYHDIRPRLKLPPEEGRPLQSVPVQSGDELEATLREVLIHLRAQTGRDFIHYKRATILRRLARRLSVNGIDDLVAYLAFMRSEPAEPKALLKDLLISVTNFFRDREAFDGLAEQVPKLFEGKSTGDFVRVWVPACASGEEAYSIAMLLFEHARTLEAPPAIQIFATDLDLDAIRTGREALYPTAITADVSEQRLRSFFTRELHGYRIRGELREAVLFAVHDALRDVPFSRLDLLSCRNLLIYLTREAQARFLETAHFALLPGGRLFLGASETVDARGDLFAPIDKHHRVYQPRWVGRPVLPALPGTLGPNRAAGPQPRLADASPARVERRAAVPLAAIELSGVSWRELHLKLVERFAPPSIVVNEGGTIVHLSQNAGRFLRFAGGEPTTDLVDAVLPALSIDLRTALLRARDHEPPVETPPVPVRIDGDDLGVVIRVARADDLCAGFLLVTFETRQHEGHGEGDAPAALATPAAGDDNAARLGRQVDELRWHLRDVTESAEVATQELRASNEELQAMNEELRSATEELETSREELQSINEELTTVNQELKSSVDGLGRANADLRNLMAATAIATIFLDRELRIRLFTPLAQKLFNLIGSDVGRPLSDLVSRLEYPEIGADARRVLAELAPIEREVHAGAEAYLARGLPYRGDDDRIAGVVFTFLDITVRKVASDALRESEAQLRAIVSQAAAGVAHLDLGGRFTFVNPRYAEMHGYADTEMVGMKVLDLVHPADRDRDEAFFDRLVAEAVPFEIEKRHLRQGGGVVWVSAAVTPLLDDAGRPQAVIAILLDITARKQADHELRQSEQRLRFLLENAREYAIVGMEIDRSVTSWNRGAEHLLGFSETEIVGRSADVIFTEEDRLSGAPERESGTAITEGRAADERWHLRKDGSRFWGSGVMMAMHDTDSGEVVGLLKIFRDQTAVQVAHDVLETSRSELVQALVENRRARAEAEAANSAKDRFLAILSHELRTPMTPVVMALHALDRSPDLPASARSTLDVVMRNVRAELRLIDDLLDVTRIASGKFELMRERVDMHQVIRAAAEVCETDLSQKKQRLRLVLGAPRPAVSGDGQRLQQVVWNLLKNASKFTPAEGDIRIETRNVDSRFVFVVTDNGIGIETEALSSIFDEFAQEGPWITTEFGGLGLGLAIAKATVEAHHGTLVASSPGRGQGASFTVELPSG